jgi:hypothetical protein
MATGFEGFRQPQSVGLMLDERALRRPGFSPGCWVRFADGQVWALPGPADVPEDPTYPALVRAVGDAESPAEQLRGELALAIYLLGLNYDLDAEAYEALLDQPAASPALAAMQRALSETAGAHADALRRRSAAEPVIAPTRRTWEQFSPRRLPDPAG